MKHETQKHPRAISQPIKEACPERIDTAPSPPVNHEFAAWRQSPPPFYTVSQFAERNTAFTESALRNLIFKAEERHSSIGIIPGNGLIESGAIIRRGRKVLLHETRFFAWLDAQQNGAAK